MNRAARGLAHVLTGLAASVLALGSAPAFVTRLTPAGELMDLLLPGSARRVTEGAQK
jgi:hypothetical protein